MRLDNKHNTIRTATMQEVLAFASRGSNTARVYVRIKNTKRGPSGSYTCFSRDGSGYSGKPIGYAPHTREPIFPRVPLGTLGYLVMTLPPVDSPRWPTTFSNNYRLKRIDAKWPDGFPMHQDTRDVLIYLAAHEFRHHHQHLRRIRTGKAGKGEYDAELHGLRTLNKWREATGREPIPEVKQPNPFERIMA